MARPFSSGPRHLGPERPLPRLSPEARRRNVRLLAYNTRFLGLPWVRVPYLASHLLGRMARQLPADWARLYGHEVCFAPDLRRHHALCASISRHNHGHLSYKPDIHRHAVME